MKFCTYEIFAFYQLLKFAIYLKRSIVTFQIYTPLMCKIAVIAESSPLMLYHNLPSDDNEV